MVQTMIDRGKPVYDNRAGPSPAAILIHLRDSWVIGDEPYVSLHFLGSDQYAK